MKRLSFCTIALALLSLTSFAQIPRTTLVSILKAEDRRVYDARLERMLTDSNPQVRIRAMLASGRIGDERALPTLLVSLTNRDESVAEAAAFAIGEIESVKAVEVIVERVRSESRPKVLARLLEAAGKVAGANAKDNAATVLGEAVNRALERESQKGAKSDVSVIRLGMTAAMRARGDGAAEAVALFLTHLDNNVRADAGNAYARLRGKNANAAFRAMLVSDEDPLCRANAARALGVSSDTESVKLLLEASLSDNDSRVRVSAVRALASIGDPSAASALISRAEELLAAAKRSNAKLPDEKSELLEIASTLGRLLQFTDDARAVRLFKDLRLFDRMNSSEIEIAFARISPNSYLPSVFDFASSDRATPADSEIPGMLQALAEFAKFPEDKAGEARKQVRVLLARMIGEWASERAAHAEDKNPKGIDADVLVNAFASFKSENTSAILRPMLSAEETVQTRAAIVSVLSEQPPSKENFDAVKAAFDYAMANDVNSDDAAMAALEALNKIDKRASVASLLQALKAPNLIVRRKAVELLRDPALKDVAPRDFEEALRVTRWPGGKASKLGQVLASEKDYARAASRKNGSVKAVFTTEKGTFTVMFLPEDAPMTVDNFVTLARRNYFNGLTVHRVVPNFVMQDGDPEGNGNGGPGWSIRCEVNMVPYHRGTVGMALSGKDTGGSQWFVTHSPQPHLDGGYTVFGKVSERDMKVVDRIVRGDKILRVRIIGK